MGESPLAGKFQKMIKPTSFQKFPNAILPTSFGNIPESEKWE
jgi:hypothetical protein